MAQEGGIISREKNVFYRVIFLDLFQNLVFVPVRVGMTRTDRIIQFVAWFSPTLKNIPVLNTPQPQS